MEHTENQRIKIIRQVLNLSQLDFSVKLNMKQGSISDIERGKTGVSNKLKEILYKDFYINRNWIENGTGDMFYKEVLSQNSHIAQNDNIKFNEINNKPNVNNGEFNDVSQLNNKLTYPINSTFPDKPTSELWQLIDNQQQQIRNLMQQVILLNNQVNIMNNLIPKS